MSLTDERIWQYSAPPAKLPITFFTAGVFIDESNEVLTVIDKVGGVGSRNPKLPGGITQASVFQDNTYFQALRAILENCKTFKDLNDKEGRRIYSSSLVEEIIDLEKTKDRMNDKYKIAKRNVVLEFLEETGCYPKGEIQFCWYQLQKTRMWNQYFFLVKELYRPDPTGLKLLKVRKYYPIEGFISVDEDIKYSKSIPFSCALKFFKKGEVDLSVYDGEEQVPEKNPDCLFPPHQNAIKAAGYYKSLDDARFSYLYQELTFNPAEYW